MFLIRLEIDFIMKTIKLCDGKYVFEIWDNGQMISARRNGEDWPAGFRYRFSTCFMAMLERIAELELEVEK